MRMLCLKSCEGQRQTANCVCRMFRCTVLSEGEDHQELFVPGHFLDCRIDLIFLALKLQTKSPAAAMDEKIRIGAAEALIDMPVDTLQLYRKNVVVVADIVTVPADTIDSIWVKVARDEETLGWIHESQLLTGVSPDDPISAFIDFFSNAHLLIFLAIIAVTGALYVLRRLMRRRAKIVHLNDIPSFYPTLLCLLVATSATLYSSIQLFDPEMWRHFYYHPTLNPYAVPFWLCVFLCSLWAAVLVAVATLDDVRRRLPFGEAILYLLGLVATCAVVYVVFSVLTMYYVGYLLLPVYIVWALRRYLRQPRSHYRCGHCGAELQEKGYCPRCGAMNV